MTNNTKESFTQLITKVSSRYRKELNQTLASKGFENITPDYFIVLERLCEEDNITIGQLAKRTSKDNAALSRIVDGMERNDLVNRIVSPTDKRSYKVVLTKYAKGIVGQLKSIEEAVLLKTSDGLNPIEVKELIRMLEHIYEQLH